MPRQIFDINVTLTKKQAEAWQYLDDHKLDYVLFGGAAGGGKSFLGALRFIYMSLRYPGTRYFIGREELKRCTMTTLRTFFKACKYLNLPVGKGKLIYYNAQKNIITFANGSEIDILELKFLPSDPMYERFGSSEYTQGWIEEAGEVHFLAFDVLKSRVGRHMNDHFGIASKIFLTCNPKKNWLYTTFYQPWKNDTLPDNMAFIQALVGDNKYRDESAERNLKNITNKAQKERLLYGNWEYSDEPDQLIPYDLIYSAVGLQPVNPDIEHALGVDVARFGDDKSVISRIKNGILEEIRMYEKLRTTELAVKVRNDKHLYSIEDSSVKVDGDGLGAGVLDVLKEDGITATEIHSGGKPTKTYGKDFEMNYKNVRTQLWFEFKQMLIEQKFGISEHLVDTEEFRSFINDVTSIKYKVAGDEKTLALEPKDQMKKRIGHSPDVGDSVIYATCSLENADAFFWDM